MALKIIHTEDGSPTIYLPELDEHYHSVHGAVQESTHVFLEAGLKQISKREINVFELGFGTGLNALLTYQFAHKNDLKINYQSIEKYPLNEELYLKLNYAAVMGEEALQEVFLKMHRAPWGEMQKIDDHFSLHKIQADAKDFVFGESFADLVYFDAFAPDRQPKLWSREIFEKMFCLLRKGGMLTTYSAKGDVRRNMLKAGFRVEKLPGPPGKWEMLRALK